MTGNTSYAYQVTGCTQWEVYSGLENEHFTPRCEESEPAIHLYFRVSISHLGARKVGVGEKNKSDPSSALHFRGTLKK